MVSLPELYHLLKLAHILGAAMLFGTGTGIAFFMLMAHRSRDVAAIAPTATIVVIADVVFTASAVVVQPITGIALAHVAGYSLTRVRGSWCRSRSICSSDCAGCRCCGCRSACAIWRSRRCKAGPSLPADYERYFRYWFILGWPAFVAMIAIFWLMITRPQLW